MRQLYTKALDYTLKALYSIKSFGLPNAISKNIINIVGSLFGVLMCSSYIKAYKDGISNR